MDNELDIRMSHITKESTPSLYEGVKHVAKHDDWYFWDDTDRKLPRVHLMSDNVLTKIVDGSMKKSFSKGLTKGAIAGGIAGGVGMWLYSRYQRRRWEEEYLEDEE